MEATGKDDDDQKKPPADDRRRGHSSSSKKRKRGGDFDETNSSTSDEDVREGSKVAKLEKKIYAEEPETEENKQEKLALEKKRATNRRKAAKFRQRIKTRIADLTTKLHEQTQRCTALDNENKKLRLEHQKLREIIENSNPGAASVRPRTSGSATALYGNNGGIGTALAASNHAVATTCASLSGHRSQILHQQQQKPQQQMHLSGPLHQSLRRQPDSSSGNLQLQILAARSPSEQQQQDQLIQQYQQQQLLQQHHQLLRQQQLRQQQLRQQLIQSEPRTAALNPDVARLVLRHSIPNNESDMNTLMELSLQTPQQQQQDSNSTLDRPEIVQNLLRQLLQNNNNNSNNQQLPPGSSNQR